MKRVLIAASAAMLLLSGCGGGEETAADAATTAAAAPAETEAADEATTGAAEGGTDRMAGSDDVRSVCEAAVGERLAGAEFPDRAILRAASTESGKLYTVSGAAQAGGTEHPYTCDVTLAGDSEVTVDATTVDGQ